MYFKNVQGLFSISTFIDTKTQNDSAFANTIRKHMIIKNLD